MTRRRRFGLGLAALLLSALPLHAQQTAPEWDEASRAALHAEIRAYLLANPEIMMEMYALLEERQRAESAESDRELISELSDEIFSDGYSFVGGNPEGDITLVEFLDYQCGYCRRAHPEIVDLVESDGNIRLVVKEFPILGPNSELAARAALSTQIKLGDEAYLRLHNAMMESQGQVTDQNLDALLAANDLDPDIIRGGMDDPQVTERIVANHALAEKLSISGTPTFVLGDEMIRGYVPTEQMLTLVAQERAQTQQ